MTKIALNICDWGEVNNEIHRDILPRFFGRLEWHDGSKWKVMAWFRNLALRAGASEFEDIAFEMISSEVSFERMSRICETQGDQ